MKNKPSEYFLGAILRGYDREKVNGKPVTPSGIWDHIVIECLQRREGFVVMFAWDTRKGDRNRIRTIMECLEAGLVPGLRLDRDGKGRAVVVGSV